MESAAIARARPAPVLERCRCPPVERTCRACQTATLETGKRSSIFRRWTGSRPRFRMGSDNRALAEPARWGKGNNTDWLSLLGKVKEEDTWRARHEMLRLVNAFPRQDRYPEGRRIGTLRPDVRSSSASGGSEKTNKFDDFVHAVDQGTRFHIPGIDQSGGDQPSSRCSVPRPGSAQLSLRLAQESASCGTAFPGDKGVLVVRSKGDFKPGRRGSEQGAGGEFGRSTFTGAARDLKFDVNNWSEGCQVINGSAYIGPNNDRIDCSSFVATNNGEVASNPSNIWFCTTFWLTSCWGSEAICRGPPCAIRC